MDLRDAFFGKIFEIIRDNKQAILMTADHGAFWVSEIEKNFPDQYINVGIAEQNMLSTAAGLALCGKKVFVYGINNFIIMRSLEQLNIDICGMNLDVNLIGVGSGFTYSTDGPTHHGVQDLAAVINLPNIKVFNITDKTSSIKIADISLNESGPKYFRIEKGTVQDIYDDTDDFNEGLKLINKTENPKITLISTGYMTQICYNLINKLDIEIDLIDVYRVSPINKKALLSSIRSNIVLSVEENLYSGGLGEKIASILLYNNKFVKFDSVAVENGFCFYYGTREQLQAKYNIDETSIINKIKDLIIHHGT